jgi:hypothetical protein
MHCETASWCAAMSDRAGLPATSAPSLPRHCVAWSTFVPDLRADLSGRGKDLARDLNQAVRFGHLAGTDVLALAARRGADQQDAGWDGCVVMPLLRALYNVASRDPIDGEIIVRVGERHRKRGPRTASKSVGETPLVKLRVRRTFTWIRRLFGRSNPCINRVNGADVLERRWIELPLRIVCGGSGPAGTGRLRRRKPGLDRG